MSSPRLALRAAAALLCLVPATAAFQLTRSEGPPSVPFPVALFAAHPPEGDAPLAVRFTDKSLGEVTSWHWDFGDGTSSSLANPSKVFEAGVYSITLTVTGPGGHSKSFRPQGVIARSCALGNARLNRGFPLERGEDFVPVTGNDALGFYCVYSGKASDTGPGIANNVGIYLIPLAKGEVLLFGAGYGDANWFVNPTESAEHDARRVDSILRFCLGRDPERTPLRFATPHGHIDHINADFVRELRRRRYPIAEIAFHSADSNSVKNLPGWTTADRAVFRTLRNTTAECQEELASYASPLGRIWLFLRAGHTAGALDLVIDVGGDSGNRFVVRGSGESYGSCPIPNVREAIDAHGNVQLRAPKPQLFALGPPNGSVLGNTTVVLSGAGFRASHAGLPEVSFDGVAASAVSVLDDATLTCLAPPGLPGSIVDVHIGNRNGQTELAASFAYRPLPILSGLAPARGPATGGTSVTLRGTGFLANAAGENVVTFGGLPASAVRVLEDGTLVCNAPARAVGTVDVRLANENGAVELRGAFQYVPAIDVSLVTPALGSARGGTPVVIEGAAFAVGASVPTVTFGGVAASSVVRLSDTRLSCVTPAGPGGAAVDVRVSGENGADALSAGFRYFQEPKVFTVAPASGPDSGGALITLTGSHFTRNDAGPNTVRFGGVLAGAVVTVSDTALQCRVPAGVAGTSVAVEVSNANGTGRLDSAYRYHRRPSLSGLEPDHGGREGGTLVTLRGAGFLESGAGLPVVTFDGLPASAVTLVDDATLTCRTPAASGASTVAVALQNGNGGAELAGAFRYVSRPLLGGLVPAAGPAFGDQLVTLTGSGFQAPGAGTTHVSFAGAPARAVSVLSDTVLTCRTPFARAGTSADVVLSNDNGSALLSDAFRYLALPRLSSVVPGEGPPSGGTRVLLSGSGFAGSQPQVRFGEHEASDVRVLDDRRLECTTPSGAAGAVVVSVRTAGGPAALADGFVYGVPRVVLTRVQPDHGASLGGNTLVLEGASFLASDAGPVTVTFGGQAASAVVVQNDTRLTCLPPAGAPGSLVDVRVSNANGSATRAGGYRYHLQPSLAGLAPGEGGPLGGLLVTLQGTGFANDDAGQPTVRFGGVPASAITVLGDSSLSCRTPPGPPNTSVDVELENANGRALLADAFRYRGAPTLGAVTPSAGSPLGGTLVTLSGSDFTLAGAGPPTVRFGGAPASQVVVVDDATLTCLVPAGAGGSSVEVSVTNLNGSGILPGAFRYHAAPAIATVGPQSGMAAGGTVVVLTGTGFRNSVVGPNAVAFGGRPARSITTVDDTRVRVVTPAGTSGEQVDVTLSNSNGLSTRLQGFRYHAQPTLLALDPPAASALGGTTVTLHGSGFLADGAGANSVLFGALPAVAVVVLDDQTLRCVEPGGAGASEVPVTLTNANGTATALLPFRYFPGPRIDELVPPHGFSGGGALVELRGAAFLDNEAGSNLVYFGTEEASEVTLLDDGTLRCRVPAGNPGPCAVRVENANGAANLPDGFYYDWAPSLTALEPQHGSALGGDEVRLTGGGFATAGAGPLSVRFGAAPATDVRVLDGQTLLCRAPPGAAGTSVAVFVSNPRGTASLSGFRYHQAPTLASLEPDSGPPEGGTLVTLLGSGFLQDDAGPPEVRFGAVPATDVLVLDDGSLQCRAPAGPARTRVSVTLTNRNGADSFVDGFGWRARDPGDLDDDGIADAVLVGTDGVYVFFGAAFALADETTASVDLVLRHSGASTDFGAQVTAGDLNADGRTDLVVGAPLDDGGFPDAGAVYVFFGPLSASPTPRLAGSANAIFRGAAASDRFGASLAVRDVTGDGLNDLVVGAPLHDAAGTDGGAVYVYRGRTGFAAQTPAQAAVRLLAPSSLDTFGVALAAADVTGDGFADVIVGAPLRGGASEGAVYVFRGGPDLVTTTAASAQVTLDGDGSGDRLGSSVAAGDFDGDGIDDLFLGAPDARSGGITGGALYFVRGGVTLVSRRVDQDSLEIGCEGSGDRLGQTLAVGEVNGDGRADLLVGAPQHDVPATNAGRAYLLLGGTLQGGAIGQLADAVLMAESSSGDQFGAGLACADLDGDGRDELIVGAPFSNAGAADSGRAHVFLGASLQAARSAGADDVTFSGTLAGQALGREIGSTR